MKKIYMLITLFLATFLLSACQEEDFEMKTYEHFRSDNNPVVTMHIRDIGTMKIELFPDVAPNTVNNFIKYVEDGFYDGVAFHRVIEGFVVQGGQNPDLNTRCAIEGEFVTNEFLNPLIHSRGVISMARTNDPNSATSQFFLMHRNAPHLDENYAAFGVLIEGYDVLDIIATTETGPNDRPTTDKVIETATVILNGYEPDEVACYQR